MQMLKALAFLLPISLFSQTQPLQNFFKAEAGFQGINAGYELAIARKLLLDFGAGVGGAVNIYNANGSMGAQYVIAENELFYFSPNIHAQMRYYPNRAKREARGHSLVNNTGSFLGLQSKVSFHDYYGNSWVTDVHFGQQLPLGSRLFFRYRAGAGIGLNIDTGELSPYPAIGATLVFQF